MAAVAERPRARSGGPVGPPSAGWWGNGPSPHLRWPGVTIEIKAHWVPIHARKVRHRDEDGQTTYIWLNALGQEIPAWCGDAGGRWESPDGRYYYDQEEADRAVDFFPTYLSHHIGEFSGDPFVLLPYQEFLLTRPIFGWLRASDGLRRFRKVFAFIPKGGGKSPWGAGTGLYMTLCDREPAAETYAVAGDKLQARTVFDNSKVMIEESHVLNEICEVLKDSIYHPATRSSYKVLSSDASTKHGFRPHCVIFDEFHGQRKRDLYEALSRSMVKRRHPLMILITHAGDDDEGICYEEYELAKRVLSGTVPDDTFLPVIFESTTEQRALRFQSFDALERLDRICTCRLVPTTLVEELLVEAYVRLAIAGGTGVTKKTTVVDVLPIPIDGSAQGTCAPSVTSSGFSTETQSTRHVQSGNVLSGLHETQIGSRRQRHDGETATEAPSQRFDDAQSTDSRRKITNRSSESNEDGVLFAGDDRPSLLSTIVTKLEKSVGSCVQRATLDSAISEILHDSYAKHSNTCAVRHSVTLANRSIVVSEVDDWTSPDVWRRVNPGHGITVKHETIASDCQAAISEPRKRNDFLRFTLNRWTSAATAWIPVEWWDACESTFDDVELKTLSCSAGLDLAQKWDIACFAVTLRQMLNAKPGEAVEVEVVNEDEAGAIVKKTVSLNYRMTVVPFFWIPEDTMREHEKLDGVPYSLWAERGLVIPTEGVVIDTTRIFRDIVEVILPRFPLLKQGNIGYDPAFATDIAIQLRDRAHLNVIEVPQNYTHLSEPSQIFEALVKGKRFRHDGHRVLRSHVENVAVKSDDAGRIKPVKPKKNSTKRIDGVVASVMGVKGLLMQPVQKSYQIMIYGGKP